ncbi:caspase family protein [Streptomyces sp. enrichment culture]|uniref:caspase family protein n=1 Tax=Streptomyces sp. enrichment culture TaxID=1795815 RepID=UPI003F564425
MTLYALLVGIDDYREPVTRLNGCSNDIRAVTGFLRGRLPKAGLSILSLPNASATRSAVIDGFRCHLGRAAAGDSALFWFSGHGSQAPVPAEFARFEPTGMLQTLVCADSRHGGVPDLYDKELAVLVGEITRRGVHTVVVLDCCHADSGTREPLTAGPPASGRPPLRIRHHPAATTSPPLDTLLEELRTGPYRTATAADGFASAPHVLLAACHSDQYAVEVPTADGPRGLFSLALLEQLESLGLAATPRELMPGARCRVEDSARAQVPVLSPAADAVVDRPLLGGRVRTARSPVTLRRLRGRWEIDSGACHGVPSGGPGDPVRFAVHGSDPLAEVTVRRVLTDHSVVEPLGWAPEPDKQYPVVLTSVPLPAGAVALDDDTGDAARIAGLITAALDSAGPGGLPSPHVRAVGTADAELLPDLRVRVPRPATVRICASDGTPLVPDVPCGTPDQAARVVTDLEHITRWRRVKDLRNPVSALADAVSVEVVAAARGETVDDGTRPALRPGADGAVHLSYRRGPAGWEEPEVFLRLRNTTSRRLYCALLDLTDRFRIHPQLFTGDWIAPRHVASAAWGGAITMSLPPGRPAVPGATGTDWLKVLVAETPFSSAGFVLGRLGEPEPTAVRTGGGYRPVLDRLGLVALHRDAEAGRATAGDWATTVLPVVVHVPAD